MPSLVPHVSVAQFKAAPTFLDLDDLRVGDTLLADQDAELLNVLLRASAWADGQVRQPLAAHTVTNEQRRLRTDTWGQIKTTPSHGPVRRVTAFAYGYTPTVLTSVTDLTGVWVEGALGQRRSQSQVIIPLTATPGVTWSGSLQFGDPGSGNLLFTQLSYEAGYPNTLCTGAAAASSLTVTDPTGLQPGDTLRIYDPGVEEVVTVASTYTAGQSTVPLNTPLVSAHTGAQITGFPADLMQAVIFYATAILLRPDTSTQDPFADAKTQPSTRMSDPRKDGSGLVLEAARLLRPYRRVR